MAIVVTKRIVELRNLRELDMLVPGVEVTVGREETRGEVEAYSLCLRLLNSFGKRLDRLVGNKIVEAVQLSEVERRRVEWALNSIKGNNARAIESSESKTMMLDFLRGHIRGIEEAIRLLEEAK